MTAKYELWYANDIGDRIQPIGDIQGFEYTKVLGSVGIGRFDVPLSHQAYVTEKPDRRINVYRANTGSTLALDFVCILRSFDYITNENGQTVLSIQGHDLNGILDRRVVAYYAGSSESVKSGAADDMMKEIFSENFLTDADYVGTPSRSLSPYLTVQRDLSQGDTIYKGFSWKNCLNIFQDIQATTKKTFGSEVFFGLVYSGKNTAEFRTWLTARDRTASGVNPIIFSEVNGNLINARLSYNWFDSKNVVIAGGQGHEDARTMGKTGDTDRQALSRFARSERFIQSNSNDLFVVANDAHDELKRRRAKTEIIGDLLDTPLTPYGGLNGWQLGDKVTISKDGIQFDTFIRSVKVKVDSRGKESISSRVENEN